VLAGTPVKQSFTACHALADSKEHIWIREKTLEFSTVTVTWLDQVAFDLVFQPDSTWPSRLALLNKSSTTTW